MTRVELFDRDSIDAMPWPSSPETMHAQSVPLSMLKEGVERYISNIQTHYFFLKVDDVILPITVNEKEYENSYLTSNYFAVTRLKGALPKVVLGTMGLFLKGVQVNRVVIVNNWLLTSAIYPQLSAEQLELVTSFLKERFPYHLLMFRGLNVCVHESLIEKLEKLKYHKFYSRKVFCYDSEMKKGGRTAYHQRRDLRLMEKEGYHVVKTDDYERLIDLYNYVYKEKHSDYCPHYTREFVKKAIEGGFLNVHALEREGKIVGVFGCCVRNGEMIVPFFGYDIHSERRTEVYRILTMLIIKEAEERKVVLNDGSGGERAKAFRGMKPFNEYAVVYAQHLKWPKRLFWGLSERLANLF